MRLPFVLAVGLAVASRLMGPGPAAADDLIEIASHEWTDQVTEDRQHGRAFTETAPVAPLNLWMLVKASPGALKALAERGKLPIFHQWFRLAIAGTSAEGATEMIDSIALDAGRPDLLRQLGLEVERRGFFDWRTWSRKDNIRAGTWLVRIKYADNTPVRCGGQPCEFRITVK